MHKFRIRIRLASTRLGLLGAFSVCVLASLPSRAQAPVGSAYTRHEVALGLSSQPFGPTLRYTFNLSPSLALETRLTGLPSPYGYDEDSMQLTAGVKAGVRRGRWDFSGVIEPGWGVRPDSDIVYGVITIGGMPVIAPVVDRPILRSRVVLGTGIATEVSLTPRTFLRFDFLDVLEPAFDQTRYNSPNLRISSLASVRNYGDLTLTAGHRFGRLLNEPDAATRPPHIEAGALFSLYARTNLLLDNLRVNPGYGGWVAASMARHLDIEATAARLPGDDHTGDYQDGGTQALAFAGIKAGTRHDRLGIFLKVRGGGIRFSRTYGGDVFPSLQDYFNDAGHSTWQPALDLGGVVEVYPARHIVLRAEVGPTIVFYRATTFGLAGQSYSIPSAQATSILLLFGGGLRF